MDSRATHVVAALVASALLSGCRHAPKLVAATGSPTPSPTTTPAVTPTPRPTPTPSPTVRSASPSASPQPPRACATDEVSVAIRTSKASYAPGELVVFDITAKNVGAVRCQVDVQGLYLYITDPTGKPIQTHGMVTGIPRPGATPTAPVPKGQPHPPEAREYVRTLRPGETFTEDCDWNGQVDDPANSPAGWKRAAAGTYHATAHWQYPRVTSGPVAFRLTN